MMKKLMVLVGAVALMVSGAWSGEVTASTVTAQQRYPWNGLVDITVTLSGEQSDVSQTVCTFAATNCSTGAAVPITSVSQNGVDAGSGTTWTRRFIWNATNDVGEVKIADLALAVNAEAKPLGGVQLWENGPYWAECNVGATKPEEYGYYFWWGDTVGYKRNQTDDQWIAADGSGGSFLFKEENCPTLRKSNSELQSLGYIDSTGNLVTERDAATAHLGAPWRMPTTDEIGALIDNCTTTWMIRNNVCGRLVIGKGAFASRSIFIPAAGYASGNYLLNSAVHGYCGSSTPSSLYSDYLCVLYFNTLNFSGSRNFRDYGHPVRPLREFVQSVGVVTHLELDTRTFVKREAEISMEWACGH